MRRLALGILVAAMVAARPAWLAGHAVELGTGRTFELRLRGGCAAGGAAPAPPSADVGIGRTGRDARAWLRLTDDGGVRMTSLVPGNGGLCPQSAAYVFCHVRGHYVKGGPRAGGAAAEDGGSKMQLFFDSKNGSDAGGDAPVQLLLSDAGNMLESSLEVEALARAVKKMRVGERARVVASSTYAFGAIGCNATTHAGWVGGQVVPANATVVLLVELLRFGEENVLRDAMGSVLVTYLRSWPPVSPSLSQRPAAASDGGGASAGAGCFFDAYAARAISVPWRKLRRGVGWRTAFSGGDVEKVEVLLRFLAVDATGRLVDWSGREGGCVSETLHGGHGAAAGACARGQGRVGAGTGGVGAKGGGEVTDGSALGIEAFTLIRAVDLPEEETRGGGGEARGGGGGRGLGFFP